MDLTLTISDTFAAQLVAGGKDPARAALEAFVVEGYRTKLLSESEVRKMLGYGTRMEVHALLKERDVYLHYSLEDLDKDLQAVEKFRLRQLDHVAR